MNLCDFTSVTIQTANLCIHFGNYFIHRAREQASDEDGKAIKMYIYIYTLHIAAQMAPEEQQLAFHALSHYYNLTQLRLGDSQGVEGAVGLMV